MTDTQLTAYRIPLSIFLSWPPRNYINPVRRRWLVPYAIVLEAVATLTLLARLWVRYTKRAGKLGTDDALIVISWMIGVAFTTVVIYSVLQAGIDRHVWDVDPNLHVRAGLVTWLVELFFLIATSLTKLSTLVFYRRLIRGTHIKTLIWLVNIGIGLILVYFAFWILFIILMCQPTSAHWQSLDISYTNYHCIDTRITDPLAAMTSVLTDVYALLLPEVMIKALQVSWQQKVILMAVLGCNVLTAGAGTARAVWMARLSLGQHDITWVAYEVFVWTLLETHLALVCASAPALKAFFGVYVVSPMTKATKSSGSKTQDNNLRQYNLDKLNAAPKELEHKSAVKTLSSMGTRSEESWLEDATLDELITEDQDNV